MIIYGYVKGNMYANDGTFRIKVRIPSIHGPFLQTANTRASYTRDDDLPWVTSILLPHLPIDGEVVALESVSSAATKGSQYICIGLTGGNYYTGTMLKGQDNT